MTMASNDVASPRILACLDSSPAAPAVVRAAKRLADLMHAPWEAVHVATPGQGQRPRVAGEALLGAFRLAEQLGANTQKLNGDDAAAELNAYARRQGATHFVIGAPSRPAFMEAFAPSFLRRLAKGAGDVAIEVCPQRERSAGEVLAAELRAPPLGDPIGYIFAAAMVGVATLFAVPVDRALALPNISLAYVLAIIVAAVRYGVATAVFTAVLSALAYNYFLTEPYFSLQIYDPSNVWAVFFFLLVGIFVSAVAAHTRAQTRIARRQAEQSVRLRQLAHALGSTADATEIAALTSETASKLLYARAVVLVPKHGGLEPVGEYPGPEMLGGDDLAAAQWAFEHGQEAGHGSSARDAARWVFVPLRANGAPVGVLGARPFDDPLRLDPEQRGLLDIVADQAGLALDRTRLARAVGDARVEAESERLKGALVSSMSHDLRTPLTTIRGAIESVLRYEDRHDPETRRELLQSALTEAEKLSRFIQNLLDMARLDTGAVRARREPTDLAGLIETVVERVRAAPECPHIALDIGTGLPLVVIDSALSETAIENVLDNARKHSPLSSTIVVSARREGGVIALEILDEGPGFSETARLHVFGKFARGVEGDGRASGPGLGLAVAKGLLDAQGISIEAENRSDRSGARVRMTIPIDGAPS